MGHKILRDFEIETEHLISIRKPNLALINKKTKTCLRVDFAVRANNWVEMKESEETE